MKKWLYILPVLLFVNCTSHTRNANTETPTDQKELDLKAFKISVPQQWQYDDPGGQEDSFVAGIKISRSSYLSFDCSNMGYANHLIYTVDEYLSRPEWYNGEADFFDKNVKKSAHIPDSIEHQKYPKADYIGEINNKGKIFIIPIKTPTEIASQNFRVDSDANYVYKTIWPKVAGKGMTGIYIHSRNSSFNFQMNGRDLSAKDQSLALQAFKTIKFPEK